MKVLIVVLGAVLAIASGEQKIVGGHDAQDGQFKYMVSIRSDGQHVCGGTIINAKTILTSAQCNIGHILQMTVVVGSINGGGSGVSHRVSEFIAHEKYNPETHENDIALIILTSDITFNDNSQPIALPTYDIGDGVLVTLSGWGLTSYPGSLAKKLQYINVRTISKNQCQMLHQDGSVFSSQICTLTKEGAGMCIGDSGGPIVARDQVHGVASYGFVCGTGRPDFFTRVNSFKRWIMENMG